MSKMKKTYVVPTVELIAIRDSLMKNFPSGWHVDNNDKQEGDVEDPDEKPGGGSTGGLIWGDND